MTVRFCDGNRPPVDLAAEAEGLFQETAEELVLIVRDLRAGQIEKAKAAQTAIRDLRTAFQLAIEERNRVEKLRKDIAGSVGAGALDLDAARDEIGRRLARLRDAGTGG